MFKLSTSIDKFSFFLLQTINSELNHELFESDISLLIEHQWKLKKKSVVLNNIIYSFYATLMITQMCQTADQNGIDVPLIVILMVMSVVLFLKELFHLQFSIKNGRTMEFFRRPDHLLRVESQLGYMVYAVFQLSHPEDNVIKDNLHLLVLTCSMYQGLFSLFNCSDRLRYHTRMIKEVLYDMVPFLTVLMGTIFLTGVIIFRLDLQQAQKKRIYGLSLFETFYESYLVMMGA